MYKQVQDISSISFPIYRLPSSDWYYQDGVLFIDGKVLDEKNMPGDSLGLRRIQSGRTDLQRLKGAITDFEGLIRSGKTNFIDSKGIPFVYFKTISVPLKYHRILDIIKKETHSLIKLANSSSLYKIPRPPQGDANWARVLYYKNVPWRIYELSATKGKDSFKRV